MNSLVFYLKNLIKNYEIFCKPILTVVLFVWLSLLSKLSLAQTSTYNNGLHMFETNLCLE